jgi:predicted alpha/beta-fold hydrolase
MNALDDPIIGEGAIDYEVFKQNENIILGINKHGGHISYYESIFSNRHWFMQPVLTFLNTFK